MEKMQLDTSKFNREMSLSDAVTALAWANPEYRDLNNGRVAEEIDALSYDEEGNVLHWTKIASNVEKFKVRVLAIIEQVMNNDRAHAALTTADPDAEVAYATDEEYAAAPRTAPKTFEDVLSPDAFKFVYERDDAEVVEEDYSNIVIDPQTITPTLLRNLGLEEYIPPKRTGIANGDQMAYMAQAIPAIKEMLQHLEPLNIPHQWHTKSKDDYFRLMMITKGPNRGYILGTQIYTDPRTKKKRKILFKTDAHGADRRLDHIMQESYVEEIRRIKHIQTTIRNVHSSLKKRADMTAESLADIRENLHECADSLKYVTDERKVKMHKDIEACLTLNVKRRVAPKFDWVDAETRAEVRPEQTKEVYNPGAIRAKLVGVPQKGNERIANIAEISRYLGMDRVVTQNFLAEQQQPFETFYKDVEELHDQFAILDLGRPLAEETYKKIVKNLASLREKCDPTNSTLRQMPLLEPYLTFGSKMVEHIDKTLELLDNEENEKTRIGAATEFTKIYLVAKIQRFYVDFMDFHRNYTSPEGMPNFNDVIEDIDKLEALIKSKPVQARATRDGVKKVVVLHTEEYDDVYHYIYDQLDELRKKAVVARKLASGNYENGDNVMKIIKAEMRTIVRNLRFDELLQKMGEEDEVAA